MFLISWVQRLSLRFLDYFLNGITKIKSQDTLPGDLDTGDNRAWKNGSLEGSIRTLITLLINHKCTERCCRTSAINSRTAFHLTLLTLNTQNVIKQTVKIK